MTQNSTAEALAQKRVNEDRINIDFFGSAGAGKSSYLSAMHRVLGYNARGMEIDRTKLRRGEIIGNSKRGINRSNATYLSCDALKVYGHIPAGIVVMNFYAPGGHRNSVPAEQATSASVYFLDLEFLRRAKEVVQQSEDFEFFPFRFNSGAFFGISDRIRFPRKSEKEYAGNILRRIKEMYQAVRSTPELWRDPDKIALHGLRYAACRAFPLELFKEDELGIVIESTLDAQLKLEAKIKAGMPLIGIKKYDSRKPEILEDITKSQESMNLLLAKYRHYLGQNDFPYKPDEYCSSISPVHNAHNLNVERFDFSGILEWHSIDSEPMANMRKEIITAAHSIATKAMRKKGIDASELKLIRFTKKNLEDGLTIHYDEL